MNYYLFVLLFAISNCLHSQNPESKQLIFQINYGDSPLLLDSVLNNDNLSINTFKFYISNISLYNNNKLIQQEDKIFHLINVEEPKTLHIELNTTEAINRIRFNIGIDSLTNHEGPKEGDLDPLHGMYWAWQSGYINMKLEGQSDLCPTRKQAFQFHLGGFQGSNNCIQEKEFEVINDEKIYVEINLKDFLEQVDFSLTNHIMSPSELAVILSEVLSSCFKIKQ